MFDKNAIINLNKPTGMSSFLAVKKVAKLLGVKKAGHMGTLDPYGTGVLLIGINRGTKLFDEYLKKKKTYIATFNFNYETDTLDSEGKIINYSNKITTKKDIKKILPNYIGKYLQMPPNFSAKKIKGKRACDLTREGKQVELKAKEIEVYDIKIIDELDNQIFVFKIDCSAGTYIRSLCRDISHSTTTYATMVSIIRTKCGDFDISNSCTLEDIKNGNFNYFEV